jgi:hypothetical protein
VTLVTLPLTRKTFAAQVWGGSLGPWTMQQPFSGAWKVPRLTTLTSSPAATAATSFSLVRKSISVQGIVFLLGTEFVLTLGERHWFFCHKTAFEEFSQKREVIPDLPLLVCFS